MIWSVTHFLTQLYNDLHVTCTVYRFGALLAPASIAIITGKHYAKNSVTILNGRSNSGNCDPTKSRNCDQTEEPSEN